MRLAISCRALFLVLLAFIVFSAPASAAKTCFFDWAVPGTYVIRGDFRGTVESTTATLTANCRVVFNIPGVFSGGPVQRAGRCLRFGFKVEGQKQVFTAQWCNTYGIVPWEGRNIRATVARKRTRDEQDWEKKMNIKSQFNVDSGS